MKWLIAVLIVVLALAGFWYFTPQAGDQTTATTTATRSAKTYTNDELGIAFEYPATYTLTENNASKAGEESYHLVLADTDELAQAPQNGEGPTTINIDIYSSDATSTEAWIRSDTRSNFQPSQDGSLTQERKGSIDGYAYDWNGLYRGQSFAFMHGERLYVISATSLTPQDQILDDYADVVASIRLL